jgi:hypothetical protein
VGELDQSLRRQTPGGGERAVLSNLVDANGAAVPEASDKLAAFLVNIEREVIPVRGSRYVDDGQADRIGVVRPPVHLNLLVMFAANFSGSTYNEALKMVEHTILFFQGRAVFTPINTPGLNPAIDQLTMEIENLNTTDLSNLWGVLGGRYLPSVLYRMRLIAIDGRALESQPRRVERTTADVAPSLVEPIPRPLEVS